MDHHVFMHVGPLAPPGTFRACAQEAVRQGVSITQALRDCNFSAPQWDRGDPLNPSGMPGAPSGGSQGDRLGTGVESVNCRAAGWNPAASGSGSAFPPASSPHGAAMRELAKAAEKAREATEAWKNAAAGPEKAKAESAMKETNEELQKASQKEIDTRGQNDPVPPKGSPAPTPGSDGGTKPATG